MNFAPSSSLYRTITRVLGISLSVTGVLFHRRGLSDWREPVFIFTCVALQELFLVLPVLRRFRSFLLGFYLMLPALFVLISLDRIEPHRGDAIALALQTPLPLLLLPIQLMVLYTREAPRLSSLVLVLTLFFVVAGLRRQVDDLVWPWLLAIGTLAMFYMAFSYPARVQLSLFPPYEGRNLAPPVSSPGGLLRGSFFGMVWVAIATALALTGALFLVVPRVRLGQSAPESQSGGDGQIPREGPGRGGSGGQRPPGREQASVSALSDSVELGDFGEIKQSGLKALELKSMSPETPRASAQPVYLRAYTYGVFNGEAWAALPTATQDARRLPATQERKRALPNARTSKPIWRQKSYVVLVFDGGTGKKGDLPVSAEPVALVDLSGEATWDPRSGVIRAPSVTRGSEYGFDCREFNGDYSALEELVAGTQPLSAPGDGASRTAASPTRSYWLLPESLVNKLSGLALIREVSERAKTRISGDTKLHSPVAAARWLVSYFRNESRVTGEKFRYSLSERPEPGADCIYRFLTTQRYGHCEYYASAMCVVLRAAGVPCRLAAGFRASRFNTERNVYEVTAADAHAWVEVYVRDYGWIPFDPTPAGDESTQTPTPEPTPTEPDKTPEPTPTPSPGEPEPTPEQDPAGRDPVVHFGPDAQRELLENMSAAIDDLSTAAQDALRPLTDLMPAFLPDSPALRAGLLATPMACVVAFWLWRRGKRRKLEKRVLDEMGAETLRGVTKRQRSLYLSLLLELARFGYHKRPFETPREFAWRVARRGGAPFGPVRELTEIFYRVRFGEDRQKEEQIFKRLLSAFAEQLRRASPSRQSPAAHSEETSS